MIPHWLGASYFHRRRHRLRDIAARDNNSGVCNAKYNKADMKLKRTCKQIRRIRKTQTLRRLAGMKRLFGPGSGRAAGRAPVGGGGGGGEAEPPADPCRLPTAVLLRLRTGSGSGGGERGADFDGGDEIAGRDGMDANLRAGGGGVPADEPALGVSSLLGFGAIITDRFVVTTFTGALLLAAPGTSLALNPPGPAPPVPNRLAGASAVVLRSRAASFGRAYEDEMRALDARALSMRLIAGRARAEMVPDQPDELVGLRLRSSRTPLIGLVAPRPSLCASYWPRILSRIAASLACGADVSRRRKNSGRRYQLSGGVGARDLPPF